jgi:hypothetical protein
MVRVHFIGGVVASNRHSDWITFVVAGLLAIASGIAAIRVWRGAPVNRRNSLDREQGLSVLKVTMAPVAFGFAAAALGLLCLNLGGSLRGSAGDSILFLIACLAGIIFVAALVMAVSLFMFTKPAVLVAPPLRK